MCSLRKTSRGDARLLASGKALEISGLLEQGGSWRPRQAGLPQHALLLAAMPRFDCTTAAGMRDALAQTHRSENTTGLLGLPEAMLNEALSQLGIKYLRRFSFASKYALARARATEIRW